MPPDPRFQTYLFSYEFQGARWSVEIPAVSETEARHRAQLMAEARYDGVLQFKIPVPAHPLTRLASWAARALRF